MGDERCSAKKCIEAKIVILGEQSNVFILLI